MLYVYVRRVAFMSIDSCNVIFEADMASGFVGATCNGLAAQRYLLMAADIPGTGIAVCHICIYRMRRVPGRTP
jgi:hypothetical protein